MKIVCLSDTHGEHRGVDIPNGDVLIHAGDFTRHGQREECIDFNDWLGGLPHQYKLIVAGNHDSWCFNNHESYVRKLMTNAEYLQERCVVIDSVSFFGSPWTPSFGWTRAFMCDRSQMVDHWKMIPDETDVLITHGPPHGICDLTLKMVHAGDAELRSVVQRRVNPKLHVFGHIHRNECMEEHDFSADGTQWSNVSVLDEYYNMAYLPKVWEL